MAPVSVALRLFGELMDSQLDVLDRIGRALDRAKARWALVGGHAVSAHVRPRVTVDVDFLVEGRRQAAVEDALRGEGFALRQDGDVLRVLAAPGDPEPVADILLSHHHALWPEVLLTAVEATYRERKVRVASRPALVVMKFLAALSPHRAPEDKHIDIADIAALVRRGWSDAEAGEAERLAKLGHTGAAEELSRLVDDLRAGRPVTI
jgi:phytoene dehydrogenase-like protein